MNNSILPSARLEGLDLARFIALAGMVLINFRIVMSGPDEEAGLLSSFVTLFEGRAAASFVILAGIGLGLAANGKAYNQFFSTTMARAFFLFVVGLLNSLIFPADILHFYAIYFLIGAWFLRLSSKALSICVVALPFLFLLLVFLVDYEEGWDWENLSYEGFWTVTGFLRNLFYNGWHPVVPWVSFLGFGILLARFNLAARSLHITFMVSGLLGAVLFYLLSEALIPVAINEGLEPEDAKAFFGTGPVPPMPIYMFGACASALFLIGASLFIAPYLKRLSLLQVFTRPGRQSLSLYIAHIVIGMGVLDMMGLIGGQTTQAAFIASCLFCVAALLYASLWERFYKRGPMEALMRRLAG